MECLKRYGYFRRYTYRLFLTVIFIIFLQRLTKTMLLSHASTSLNKYLNIERKVFVIILHNKILRAFNYMRIY